MLIYSRTCLHCKTSFEAKRKDKIFCSRNCKWRDKNAKRGRAGRRPYIRHKKDHCEKCGFIAEHKCQLDIDHIDGNHSNNDVTNLQTLCANCHRLKTYLNEDWKKGPD